MRKTVDMAIVAEAIGDASALPPAIKQSADDAVKRIEAVTANLQAAIERQTKRNAEMVSQELGKIAAEARLAASIVEGSAGRMYWLVFVLGGLSGAVVSAVVALAVSSHFFGR